MASPRNCIPASECNLETNITGMFITALVPKHISCFSLPDFISINSINQKKSKIGMQVKRVIGIVQLVFNNIPISQSSQQFERWRLFLMLYHLHSDPVRHKIQ